MNMTDYQDQAMSFRLPSANEAYALYGLVGEVGEFYGALGKSIRDKDGEVDAVLVRKELGDILWFVAAVAADFGFDLEDIAQGNIDKLSSRKDRGVIQGSGDNR